MILVKQADYLTMSNQVDRAQDILKRALAIAEDL